MSPRVTRNDALRYHRAHRENLIGAHWSERLVEKVAEGIGTTLFLFIALSLILGWVIVNGGYAFFSGAAHALAHGKPFDPAPWILLNLIFSFEAFFTGSLVVIAAKAQAKRDQLREEADANHREELATEHAQQLAQNTELTQAVKDIADHLDVLTREVHAHIVGEAGTARG